VKPQGLLASTGFGLAVVVLYVYSARAHVWSGQLALVLTAVAAWGLESQAVPRKPVDFSTAFLFYLMLALSGDAVGAALVMLAGYCVREVANRANTSDLLWLTPVIAGLAVAQSGGYWPIEAVARGGVALLVTVPGWYLDGAWVQILYLEIRACRWRLAGRPSRGAPACPASFGAAVRAGRRAASSRQGLDGDHRRAPLLGLAALGRKHRLSSARPGGVRYEAPGGGIAPDAGRVAG
jgi:hypothetical protein